MPNIRELRIQDIAAMYEWMTDFEVVSSFTIGRFPISRRGIEEFIEKSWMDNENIHFAIVDDADQYVGTVSLKNINLIDSNAEYAIVLRKNCWGKGYSKYATDLILEHAFRKMNLHKIFLQVLSCNTRAINFYEKYGFIREGVFNEHIFLNGKYYDLIWYSIINNGEGK